MELRQFVKDTLVAITNGVCDARDELNDGDESRRCRIVPGFARPSNDTINAGITPYQAVEFEVAVSVEESGASETKIGVLAGVIGGATKAGGSAQESHVSKLRFKVPVELPVDPNPTRLIAGPP